MGRKREREKREEEEGGGEGSAACHRLASPSSISASLVGSGLKDNCVPRRGLCLMVAGLTAVVRGN